VVLRAVVNCTAKLLQISQQRIRTGRYYRNQQIRGIRQWLISKKNLALLWTLPVRVYGGGGDEVPTGRPSFPQHARAQNISSGGRPDLWSPKNELKVGDVIGKVQCAEKGKKENALATVIWAMNTGPRFKEKSSGLWKFCSPIRECPVEKLSAARRRDG